MLTNKTVENFGMLGQTFGKGAAAFDRKARSAMMFFRVGIAFLLFQHAQAAQEGQTGIHQRGQLAGKSGENLGLNLAAEAGNLDVDIDPPPFFLPWPSGALPPAFFVRLFLDLFRLDDLGRETAPSP